MLTTSSEPFCSKGVFSAISSSTRGCMTVLCCTFTFHIGAEPGAVEHPQ